jgi:hypothetical protein
LAVDADIVIRRFFFSHGFENCHPV